MTDTFEFDWLGEKLYTLVAYCIDFTGKMQVYILFTLLLATLNCDVLEYCYERLKTKTVCNPTSCLDLLCNGKNESGVYTIYPTGNAADPIDVFCDQETDGGGWTVFQRRMDGSVDFYRDWADYRVGFGNLSGEFWLGNDKIAAALLANENNELRVDMESFENETAFAKYSSFNVGGTLTKYKLSVSGYTGTAGDSLKVHNGRKFSTYNVDNDINEGQCAVMFHGAWWYSSCHHANLNGKYLEGHHDSYADGVDWFNWKGHNYSLKTTEMKFRASF
ncbi:hypothetical protein EB796_022525 [Bugula neritina]|uniref:Fibrinogen C-terminal domain-containing protein n=1 Tax=Bugula neritina TaxID=10212 RepID=A0A7J7J021_BUGNE|nr:hypothetical protein EB796_022525 [Bugula neritina]